MSASRLRCAIGGLRRAALDPPTWMEALKAVAEATDADSAQLIGFEPGREALFNWWTAAEPGDLEWLQAVGGNDPAVNSRVRKGLAAGEMTVLDESHFTTAMDRRLCPAYDDYVRRKRIDNLCLVNLLIRPRVVIGFALMRGPEKGNFTQAELRIFRLLANEARAAVEVMLRLRDHSAAARLAVLDAAGLAVVVCDRRGWVLSLTAEAEALVALDERVHVSAERLRLRDEDGDRHLSDEVAAIVASGSTEPVTLVCRIDDGRAALGVEIRRLPALREDFGAEAAAIVIMRLSQAGSSMTGLFRFFGLSLAETRVALALLNGASPEDIAQQRGAALGTIRAQVRSIYAKVGVRTQLQFSALMRLAI